MQVVNPATGEVVHELEQDHAEHIARRIDRARVAQGAWAARPLAERKAILERFRELVLERADALARVTTLETGKPLSQALAEVRAFAEARLPFFLGAVEAALAPEVVHREPGLEERIEQEPLGVVANVSAWNYPYFVGGNVFVPALLTGNAVVYKPSEYAALTGKALAATLWEAGVPEGVFELVLGGGEAGAALVRGRVDAVCFTGSNATGVRIAEAVSGRLLRVQLELGGKDPAYVAPDAPVEQAAEALADGAFYNAGQSCCAVERIYVHAEVAQRFVEAFVDVVRKFRVGDPFDPDTYIGPLARRELALVHLEGQVADATRRGARVLLGGRRLPGPGFYFEPTVITGVDHGMSLMREETFGPLIGLQVVRDDEEALRLMEDTQYGLTAAVYTPDAARARRLLSRLPVGTAYWNCCDRVSPRLPWTGRRGSGLGVTLSRRGLEAFTQPKAWHLRG